MKKKKLFFIYLLIALAYITLDVNAETINFKSCRFSDGSKATVNGYEYFTQEVICGNKHFTYYCLDRGLAFAKTLTPNNVSISYISSPSINAIINNNDFEYYQKEIALRLWANNVGLAHGSAVEQNNKITTWENTDSFKNAIKTGQDSKSEFKITEISGTGSLTLTESGVNKEGNNFTATIIVGGTTSDKLSKITWESLTPGVNVTSQGERLILSGSTSRCALTVRLKANIPDSIDESSSTGPGAFIIITPNSQNKGQTGIIKTNGEEFIIPYDGTDDKNSHPVSTSNIYEVNLKLCECTGTSTLCEECNDAEVSDTKEDLLSCANNDSFKNYCGENNSIKKENDNNQYNHTQIAEHAGLVSTSLNGNPYCDVFCTEDITYKVPGRIQTQSGRYFVLRKNWNIFDENSQNGNPISVSGTRTCFTSTLKRGVYINHIRSAQMAVINAWNSYQEELALYKALTNGSEIKTVKSGHNIQTGSTSNCTGQTTIINGKTVCAATGQSIQYTPTYGSCSYTESKVKSTQLYWDGAINSNGDYNGNDSKSKPFEYTWVSEAGTCNYAVTDPRAGLTEPSFAAVTAAQNKVYQIINQYKSCFEWTNNYCFNPVAKFSYDEVYNKEIEDYLDRKISVGNQTEYFYTELTDESSYEGNSVSNNGIRTYTYATKDSGTGQFSIFDIDIKYVKKVVSATAVFNDSTKKVYTYHPYGTIKIGNCNEKNCKKIEYNDGYVLPVALEHENASGLFNYYINFSNIGVPGNDNNTCSTKNGENTYNRINSEDTDETCTLAISESKNKQNCKNEYACQYAVEYCPECDVECVCPDNKPNCYVEDKICKYKVCDNCIVECIGCIFEKGNTTISYKTISLNDVYQDDTQIASNWTLEDIEEIEKEGQKIYDKEPQYSFILTPQTMSKIREYNEISASNKASNQNIPRGGYNNDTLTCTIKETNTINCKSSFLRVYLEKNAKNAIRISPPESWDE